MFMRLSGGGVGFVRVPTNSAPRGISAGREWLGQDSNLRSLGAVGPAGFLFPTQRCAPTSLDVGAKKRLAVPCGIRELLCGNSGPCSAFHSHIYYVTVFGRIILVQAAHSFRRVDDVLQQVFSLHGMQVAFGCPSADCSCRYWVAHLFEDVVC